MRDDDLTGIGSNTCTHDPSSILVSHVKAVHSRHRLEGDGVERDVFVDDLTYGWLPNRKAACSSTTTMNLVYGTATAYDGQMCHGRSS